MRGCPGCGAAPTPSRGGPAREIQARAEALEFTARRAGRDPAGQAAVLRWFEPDICPFCWLGEVAAIKTTPSAATQRLKALQALLSRHIAAHLGMPGSIPQRERSTQKPDQCRRARTAGVLCQRI